MNSEKIKLGSLWTYNQAKVRQLYKVIDVDDGEVVATTTIDLSTNEEDSFSWLSPVEDFLQNFKPFKTK